MKHFLLITVLLSMLFFACKKKAATHLPLPDMVNIMTDMHAAEAYSSVFNDSLHRQGTKNMDSLAAFYKDIFAHYHITQNQFMQSFKWYEQNPDQLDSIYVMIVSRLSDAENGKK